MSIMSKVLETVVKMVPDKAPDPLLRKHGAIGQPLNRVDGMLKVTGSALFSAEYNLDEMVHASLVFSTIAKGRIAHIDLSRAKAAPGVLEIMTHENAPKMKAPTTFEDGGAAASSLPVMQDDIVHWNGQPIAVVLAETPEQAEYAATLVSVSYVEEKPALSFDALKGEAKPPKDILGEPPEVIIGDAEAALRGADTTVDHVYTTPRYNQNAIELHCAVALWSNDDELVMYDPTQSLSMVRDTLASVFNIKADNVRVLAPFVGGGFGGKGMLWNHTVLCAAAARLTKRPVRLVLTREGTFRIVGGRTLSEQRVALGANKFGVFESLIHTGTTAIVTHNAFPEQFSFPARHLYAAHNMHLLQNVVILDMVANSAMRAPGESIGTFALESAVDELAAALKMDPIELRKKNEPERDPTKHTPFSSRNVVEAYRRGAEQFGWANRSLQPRSQRDGKSWVGQGVATAYYPYFRFAGSARVRLNGDGTAQVQVAAHEMGMGTATVQIQHAADRLGLAPHCVAFEYGDSKLPDSTTAGGSAQTASVAAAIIAATEALQTQLLQMVSKDSPLSGAKPDDVEARDGGLYRKDGSGGESYNDILHSAGETHVEAEAAAPAAIELMKYSMHSFGAQFCEVRVNEETGEVRVSRWLGSFDCGTILNPKTAISQFRGGIIMGIGMALTEETLFDERSGRIMNPSLAEYHVPVHLDVPHIDVIYNNIPDEHTPLGAHGVGEIGITGCAAAIANAVHHATGKRIRSLPITLDKILASSTA